MNGFIWFLITMYLTSGLAVAALIRKSNRLRKGAKASLAFDVCCPVWNTIYWWMTVEAQAQKERLDRVDNH